MGAEIWDVKNGNICAIKVNDNKIYSIKKPLLIKDANPLLEALNMVNDYIGKPYNGAIKSGDYKIPIIIPQPAGSDKTTTLQGKYTLLQSDSVNKEPYKNPIQNRAMGLWIDVKDLLKDTFTVDDFLEACLKCGYDQSINKDIYNRLIHLVKKDIITKVRGKDRIPITPLTYSKIKKENPMDYLKTTAIKEATKFRDTASMS